jgi:hypothetical protein
MRAKLPLKDSRVARIRSASRIVRLKPNEIAAHPCPGCCEADLICDHKETAWLAVARLLSSVITGKQHGWQSFYFGSKVMTQRSIFSASNEHQFKVIHSKHMCPSLCDVARKTVSPFLQLCDVEEISLSLLPQPD